MRGALLVRLLGWLGMDGVRKVPVARPEHRAAPGVEQTQSEVAAAVRTALADWRAPAGGDFRVDDVDVMDEEYGDIAGQSFWIDVWLAGKDAAAVPDGFFLQPPSPPEPPGPGASPAERAAYDEYFQEPDDPVPAPLEPPLMALLKEVERRVLDGAQRACARARVRVKFYVQ